MRWFLKSTAKKGGEKKERLRGFIDRMNRIKHQIKKEEEHD
jgi:hypothetical protein